MSALLQNPPGGGTALPEVFRRVVGWALVAVLAVTFGVIFTPPRAPADGRVHIRYWEKWTGFEEEAMRRVVDAFNERQDRIYVDYLAVSQVNTKMLLATAGGNPPDVAGLWDYDVPTFADYGAIRPMDDFCKRDGIAAEDYIPCYWDICVYQDRVFALPTTPATVALHWNKKLFREAGLDPDRPPRTLEELDEYSARLFRSQGGEIAQMGYLPAEPGWWNWSWGYFFGGRLWDGKGRLTVASPENLRGYNWVKGYADRYREQGLSVFQSGFGNFSSPQNAFLSNKVAMVQQGVWMANYIHNNAPGLEWDAAPFPHPADRPDLARSTYVGMDVLVIPTGARHVKEAWEFIRFVQSQEGMELLCLGQWKHTPLRKVSDRFWNEHRNPRIRLFYELAYSPNTFATPEVGIWREWNDEMSAAFQKIWNQGETAESALAYVDRRIQPRLDRYFESLRLREGEAVRLPGAAGPRRASR